MPFRAVSLYALAVSAALLSACAGLEKSENILSPTIAGPIPGVSIGMPVPLDPKDGKQIEVANQPIALVIENAPTNGERPLNYLFEIATDTAFNNRVFVRENIAPGDGGRTSLRLSDALGTGRTYFWRARAQDGANTGPYSGFAHFNIFTPVVIGKPVVQQPINNVTIDSLVPRFLIGNAPRSGPVGALSYVIEVADSDTFANKYAVWTVSEQSGQTRLDAPSGLPHNRQYFWRTQAYDGRDNGPWSDAAVFRTPVVQAPPTTPTPTPPSVSCASQATPLAILQCRRNQYGPSMSQSQLVEFLRASAKDINTLGTVGGPWGLLVKTSGAQCNGYSCDILCLGNGSGQVQRDVLIDAEGSQVPTWGSPIGSPAIRPCEAQ